MPAKRRAVLASPHRMAALAHLEQKVELFCEEGIVVVEVVAEQRERFDERATAGHDFRPPARQKVEARKLLIDAHRIVGREHRDGARQADALRPRGPGRKHDGRRRDCIVGPVMLADPEHVEADAVGELHLLHEVGEGLVDSGGLSRPGIAPGLDEGVDAEFHRGPRERIRPRSGRAAAMVAWPNPMRTSPVTEPPISRFSPPKLADLPKDIRERIEAVQEKSGFVPNVFLALARRPDEFRAFFAYHDALMEKPGGLSKAERETIVVATSGLNHCHYCVVAHGAILRIRAKNPLIADQVATNYRKADLTPRQMVMLDFALKVAARSHEIDEADYKALRRHDFTDECGCGLYLCASQARLFF